MVEVLASAEKVALAQAGDQQAWAEIIRAVDALKPIRALRSVDAAVFGSELHLAVWRAVRRMRHGESLGKGLAVTCIRSSWSVALRRVYADRARAEVLSMQDAPAEMVCDQLTRLLCAEQLKDRGISSVEELTAEADRGLPRPLSANKTTHQQRRAQLVARGLTQSVRGSFAADDVVVFDHWLEGKHHCVRSPRTLGISDRVYRRVFREIMVAVDSALCRPAELLAKP